MSANDNIVELFPTGYRNAPDGNKAEPVTDADVPVDVLNMLIETEINTKVSVVSRQMANMILNIIEQGELNPHHVESTQDFYMVVEAIMSMLYRFHHVHHPIQDIADSYIHIDADGTIRFGDDGLDVGIEPED